MVRGCSSLLDLKKSADFLEEGTFKVSALVGVKSQWRTETADKVKHQFLSHSLSLLIGEGEGLHPAGKVVCQDQDVPVPLGRDGNGTHHVDSHTIHGGTNPEIGKEGPVAAKRALVDTTSGTVADVGFDIGTHARPVEATFHLADSFLHA